MMATQTQTMLKNEADSKEKLLEELSSTGTVPLWGQMARLNPPLPNPQTVPHVWRYAELRPYLLRAGGLVKDKEAERRVLLLKNPTRDVPCSTDTITAGLQLVMPDEVAPAHRHTAFAMRFIIEGQGGFTAVHGRRIQMQRGDMLLTPSWNWHDHGKDGSGPMIWLDNLNLPAFQAFPVHFVEHYQQERYPAEDIDLNDSPIVFPWSKMQARLLEDHQDWVRLRYLKANGDDVSKALGGAAERLNPGCSSPAIRETTSAIYHVIEGSGHSVIDGKRYEWNQGDTFAVPSWHRYQHVAAADDRTVYLYRCDDFPMLDRLGFYRAEGMDPESLVAE